MCITGQRHAFVGKYRAAASKDGDLIALDVQLYCNAGFSADLSTAVMYVFIIIFVPALFRNTFVSNNYFFFQNIFLNTWTELYSILTMHTIGKMSV